MRRQDVAIMLLCLFVLQVGLQELRVFECWILSFAFLLPELLCVWHSLVKGHIRDGLLQHGLGPEFPDLYLILLDDLQHVLLHRRIVSDSLETPRGLEVVFGEPVVEHVGLPAKRVVQLRALDRGGLLVLHHLALKPVERPVLLRLDLPEHDLGRLASGLPDQPFARF